MTDLLHEIACPNCTHAIDLEGHGRQVQCAACSSRFILLGHLCPNCRQYHQEEEPFCGRCGEPLMRRCGKCQARNWTGDEFCRQCGQELDIVTTFLALGACLATILLVFAFQFLAG